VRNGRNNKIGRNSTNNGKHANHDDSLRISGYVEPKQKPEFEELKWEAARADGDRKPRPNGDYLARLIKYKVRLDEESCKEYGKISKRRDEDPARL
jgi:hypothetical protein